MQKSGSCLRYFQTFCQRVTTPFAKLFIRFLESRNPYYKAFEVSDPNDFKRILRPCDIILVEGDTRYASMVKLVTHSSWSHCSIYIGDALDPDSRGEKQRVIVEALLEGVVGSTLQSYYGYNTRILRPVGLSQGDKDRIIQFCINQIGIQYDLKNIFHLMMRFIFGMFSNRRYFGSGLPNRVICSSMLAQAFAHVQYPILPDIEVQKRFSSTGRCVEETLMKIRHHSLYSPRDFDLSPFFTVIKPTLERGFNYKALEWQSHDEFYID